MLLPDKSEAKFTSKLPLPGVIIFVHGVNSDGEWYEAAEEGLCDGLNTRLKRRPLRSIAEERVNPFVSVNEGLLTPAQYTSELTSSGFVDAERSSKNFIKPDANYSPVIRFRWGYKCSMDDVKLWGKRVWLNEHDYWGGGPFANGCSAVADLWNDGVDDRLFAWITAQHLNPAIGRDVYKCPSRTYYVHAALRLAKLIKSIREKQADCPITVVCHSQGNVVGVGGAFLADKLGIQADNYILCNPPLSLLTKNFMENYAQSGMRSSNGSHGRVTGHARVTTMKSYLELLRARASCAQSDADVDKAMSGGQPTSDSFKAAEDRALYGYKGDRTYGRVTLYCNPHDQVISATPIQGIGWRGVSHEEIKKIDPAGDVFSQRVFASQYLTGQEPGKGKASTYNYWTDRWNASKSELKDGKLGEEHKKDFWYPPSPVAKYSIKQGIESSGNLLTKSLTVVSAVVMKPGLYLASSPINADPPSDGAGWEIPIDAPKLPIAFLPEARRFGKLSQKFDEGYDPMGNSRDSKKSEKSIEDPYDQHRDQVGKDGQEDKALGNEDSEKQQRYEDRARLRMQARRKDWVDEKSGSVAGETENGPATEEYTAWRNDQISEFLKVGIDIPATDHSTIVTNPMHAERATAYDVAIGVARLTDDDWRDLRVEADWRYVRSLGPEHPHAYLSEYFATGYMKKQDIATWANSDGDARMPAAILDERTSGKPRERERNGK
ncbi:T6SS effector phospholipase Tle3 domain-containing protein [Pseudoduganella guangdongensis]|nr:DUF3274 domain-containing protein [Pseudoduganella guangdongensis]